MKFVESQSFPPEGPVLIWEEPKWGHAYVIGADVAEGLEHGDYSDASVLDVETGLMVAKWHGHTNVDQFGEELNLLGHWYNTALIGVEVNSMGLATVGALRRKNYPRMFRRKTVGRVQETYTALWGWRTDKSTKGKMIVELAMALREGLIEVRDKHTIGELKTFVRDENAQMHGSPHDDRVISLAIAWQMMDHAVAPDYEKPKTDNRYTFDWWVDKAKEMEQSTSEVQPIGALNRRSGTRFP